MEISVANGRLDPEEEISQNKGIDIERIRNAKKRRIIQLKRWAHYDKSKEKEELNRQKKGYPISRKGPKAVRFCQNLILLEAGNSGDADEVRRLLSEGVCADAANSDGLTALHQCAINKNIDMCRILIHYKANVNAKDKELWTPLHAAAICGHSEICHLLIKHGADLLALNTDGNMPYDICEDEVTLDIIENEMATKGITQEQINAARNQPEQNMLSDLKSSVGRLGQSSALQLFCQLDKQGANYLHIAAACGYVNVTRFLLSIGMPIDALDKDGWQAIHVASLHSHLEVIEVLVSHGANMDCQTKQGETVYELVYDADIYEKLLMLKQQVDKLRDQNQNLTSSFGLVRRRSSTNPRSASIRRTSMKDKSFLSWKEARQEAEIRLSMERKNPAETNPPAPGIHLQENNDASNKEAFVNSSLRAKHFIVNESIAETDYAENEPMLDPNQIDVNLKQVPNIWVLPGLANKTDKSNFTHCHPYDSPTRDPNTFPYNPKPIMPKPPREPVSKPVEPVKPREAVPKSADVPKQRDSGSKQIINNTDPNKQRQPSDKIAPKKINTLPHIYSESTTDEVIDAAKPVSMRSAGKQQSKSPGTTHRPIPQPRTSVNSIKTPGSSSHTTPITTPRSSHRQSNRHPIKQFSNSNPKLGGKSVKPDSCCILM